MRCRIALTFALVALALVCPVAVARQQPAPEQASWQSKVHPRLLESSENHTVEFLIVLRDQMHPRAPGAVRHKIERTRWVVDRLRSHAERTQAPLVRILRASAADYRPFWIANLIWVRGDARLLERLARRPDVERIDANPRVSFDAPAPRVDDETRNRAVSGLEWGVTQIRADRVWDLGFTGEGVVIAGQDTGYQWDHPALITRYRGYDPSGTVHDHHWHDAIHTTGSNCGADSRTPCDDNGHGTHTLGTMVGDDGGSNRIGVAPDARWIACRNMNEGNGTPASYTECFQWFVAPTDLDGNDPDPTLAPDVINNSWLCPASEGCSQDTLRTVVENTRAAGIVVVVSAGNSGPSCGTVANAPAHYDAALSVGATDSTDLIAGFSGRGPVTVDGSNRLKPDLTAPGVSVRSSYPTDTYVWLNGTSMAAPHVAGVAALLLSARPDLEGNVDAIETILRSATVPLTTNDGCGGDGPSDVPNHTYGHGRIDALEVLTGDTDADGVENLGDCLPTTASVWSVPSPARDLVLGAGGAMSWQSPAEPGAATLQYDVLRSESASDFSAAACVAAGRSGTTADDTSLPATTFFYLVRARNGCGGSIEQTAPDCSP